MPLAFERRLRSTLTAIAIVTSIVIGGVAARATRRYEVSRERPPSACSAIVDSVFANSNEVPDSILLSRLLAHDDRCMSDAIFVDQTRRLMLNLQRVDDARALVSEAAHANAMSPDELKGQGAWIDLAAAHAAWTMDDEASATTLRNRAIATSNELRRSWPEWDLPYLILTEADRLSWKPAAETAFDYFALERSEQGRVLNGAFVRALYGWQPIAYVFAISLVGALGLFAGIGGLLYRRGMRVGSVVVDPAALRVWISKIWMTIGLSIFVLSVLLLAWSFHQRYGVINAPDALRSPTSRSG
jgi:hypothetical protein